MSNFKTLKDFWTILPTEQLAFPNKTDVTCHSLRAEAIKQREYKFKMAINHPEIKEFLLGQCSFIEEFFNLEDID